MATGLAVFTAGATAPVPAMAQSVATTTVLNGGSTYETLQQILNGVTAIINEAQATPGSLTPQEESELAQVVTAVQNIIAEMVPNTVATPFH